MFDWPKQRKIKKFVSWEKTFVFRRINAANKHNPEFVFITAGWSLNCATKG